jgi:sulfatase maturation enzyme AslB (radical SAM superfamily)
MEDAVTIDPTSLYRASTGTLDVVAAERAGPRVRLVATGLAPAMRARRGDAPTLETLRGAAQAVFLAGGHVVLDALVADADTTPEELFEAALELARWRLRLGVWFTVNAVVDAGAGLRPAVSAAIEAGALDTEVGPVEMFRRMHDAWARSWSPPAEGEVGDVELERLVRRVDDAGRHVVFELLKASWRHDTAAWPGRPMDKAAAVEVASRWLGEPGRWKAAMRQYTFSTVRRMVVIPTWQCELRCAYCFIPKQDGRVMSRATMERSVELLLSTDNPEVELQFFGGEALLEAELVRFGMEHAARRAAELGKKIGFILSSNGWSLDERQLAWLRELPVRLELSLDGRPETQRKFRPSRFRHEDSYANSIAAHAAAIQASGLPNWVIMVVHPTDVDAMPGNFFHIADMGFTRIQINNMLGRVWTPAQMQSFAKGLHTIGLGLMERWAAGQSVEFINMNHDPLAMRLNGEATVDWDGTIFGGNQFLHETEHKGLFKVGHLDDLTGIDRYWIDATDNSFLLDWAYRPHITDNNVEVGKVMASFIRWMNRQGFGPRGPLTPEEQRALKTRRVADPAQPTDRA